jgi:hypothetical protein
MRELERMTSIEAEPGRREVTLADPQLFSLPFLSVSGQRGFHALAPAEVERLRVWLEAGGTPWTRPEPRPGATRRSAGSSPGAAGAPERLPAETLFSNPLSGATVPGRAWSALFSRD